MSIERKINKELVKISRDRTFLIIVMNVVADSDIAEEFYEVIKTGEYKTESDVLKLLFEKDE